MAIDPRRRGGSRLAAEQIEHEGGFSMGAQGRTPGPNSYMVARENDERSLPRDADREGLSRAIRKEANVGDMDTHLNEGGFMGGWRQAVERSDEYTDRSKAAAAGLARSQQAIYDVGGGKDILSRQFYEVMRPKDQLSMSIAGYAPVDPGE